MRRSIATLATLVAVVGAAVAAPAAPAAAAGEFAFGADSLPGVTVDEGNGGGTTTASFDVTYSGLPTDSASVQWKVVVEDRTASADDFVDGGVALPSGSLTPTEIAAGATIDVDLVADDLAELDDTFVVVLHSPTGGATVGEDNAALGVVLDDDPVTATLAIGPVTVSEADADTTSADLEVSLDEPHQDADVVVTWRSVDGTATAGEDYTGTSSGAVTVPQGQQSATISVPILDDAIDEGGPGSSDGVPEDFTVELTGVSDGLVGDADTATVAIDDDDAAATLLYVRDVTVAEGGGPAGVDLVLSRPAPAGGVAVDIWLTDDTTQGSADYDTATATSHTIAAGETSATVSVGIESDDTPEATESFSVNVDVESVTPESVTVADGLGTVTIVDDDGPTATLSDTPVAVTEGGTGAFDLSLDGPAPVGGTSVTWEVLADRGALSDVSVASGTTTVGEGEQDATIHVGTIQDLANEDAETLRVRLTSVTRGQFGAEAEVALVIWDDDPLPIVDIEDAAVEEPATGTTTMAFTVTLDRPSFADVTVNWDTADDTATAGEDYTAVTDGSVTIPAGQTSAQIVVDVHADADADEGTETFLVALSAPQNATLAANPDAVATGTIIDAGAASLTVDDPEVVEGDSGDVTLTFTVARGGDTTGTVTVDAVTKDSTATHVDLLAGDYDAVSTSLVFAAGETQRQVDVTVHGDEDVEAVEHLFLDLSNASGATILEGRGHGTIVNDDGPALTVGDIEVVEGDSGTRSAFVDVSSEQPAGPDGITVEFTTQADTASADVDFVTTTGRATIAPGATVGSAQVEVTGDTVAELAERFTVALSHPSYASIGEGTGAVTILNDDGPAVSVSDVTVTEPTDALSTTAEFTVTLSASSSHAVEVDYRTEDGTATAGSDYQELSGSLTFAAGQTSKTVAVDVLADEQDEGSETFRLVLSEPRLAVLGDTTGIATVTDPSSGDGDGGGGDGGSGGSDADTGRVFRSFGETRIETAVRVSADHWSSADAAVLATAWTFPDALAGGALAAGLGGPLLLTHEDELPAEVADELERLGVRQVWILGGEQAVSLAVERAIEDLGIEVVRLAGADRFETAATVARAVRLPTSGEVSLALGHHDDPRRAWPDALSSGSLAASADQVPVLLTLTDQLPSATERALAELGAQRIRVLGGPAAIGDAVVRRLRDLGYEVDRLAGADRYATSVAVAEEALSRHAAGEVIVVFATGENYPDGLAAGAFAARFRALVVLVPKADLNVAPVVERFLTDNADRFDQGVVVGGGDAVTEDVRLRLEAAMRAPS